MIYLDHNATTPVDPRVREGVLKGLETFGNPSSRHQLGLKARELLEKSRQKVAWMLNADPSEVVFTSGGTESNNLAIIGYTLQFKGGHIVSTQMEHPSVLKALEYLSSSGFEVSLVRPDSSGVIEPDAVKEALREDTILVSIMHSNNETGVLQPIGEISSILKDKGVVFHTDASQSVGRVPVDVRDLGVDMLTIAGHKFHAPKGIGALYVRDGIRLSPVLYGGGQERGLRPGTEPLPLIVGLSIASVLARQELPERTRHMQEVTALLWRALQERIDRLRLNCEEAPRLPNTLNITIEGVSGRELVSSLAEEVALSAGSACHEGGETPSHVLMAIGISPEDALSSVRLSTGKDTTTEDVLKAAELISRRVEELRTKEDTRHILM